MLALHEYHHGLNSLEKELRINGGWLKPNRLKELSGVPARLKTNPKVRRFRLGDLTWGESPNSHKNWRDYFAEEELNNIGSDGFSSGSDSSPSVDDLEEPAQLISSEKSPTQAHFVKPRIPQPRTKIHRPSKRLFTPQATASRRFELDNLTPGAKPITLKLEASCIPMRPALTGKYLRKVSPLYFPRDRELVPETSLFIRPFKGINDPLRISPKSPVPAMPPLTKSLPRRITAKRIGYSLID